MNARFRTARRTVLAGFAAGGLAACTPGSSGSSSSQSTSSQPVSTDIASLGDITLTVWDQNLDEGIDAAQKKLNDQFTAKYPNVKVNRVARSFADLKTTLKLALSGDDAPDVVQANQGYPDMGAFVQAKLLQPVDPWDDLYGWTKNFPTDLLSLNSFSPDGKTWRTGNLYGISATGEIVGLFYNKKLLAQLGLTAPTTMEEFEASLPTIAAAGQLPIQYGDADKSAGIHVFGALLSAVAGEKAASDLVSSAGGKWTDPDVVSAATTLREWATKEYLPDGHNGIGKDEAVARFGQGQGVYMFNGTWYLATLQEALGTDVGFAALAGVDRKPETLGGVGLAWALTSRTANANAAAAYVDFVTNAAASQVLVDTGNLPVVFPDGYQAPTGTLAGDVATSWDGVSQNGGLVPYLDYATPTFYDTLSGAVQQLTGGQADPQQFTQTLQSDYESFQKDR
ncbi:extracellular solute-binding protein [Kineococcus rhizosphaerae]|uniref:Carbohydrate ABC transporter substrate-binding protein (CUT1 family) n=1 Tax=Kineococcus rhizosphaerae TaxID=559628 RepID=A0A2T0QX29_9ACTN|nr:extracellular solute-binding protein [Kineococcus rhizosphaerae]PRY10265.1 carbohydrate ABC transporter substrate-binding protein (CUT1 family) [Kineococcus rhizosphaerae]